MPKRGRPLIHPPKTPAVEDPEVTIAMQERQINMLISRVEQLTEENGELQRKFNGHFETTGDLAAQVGNLQSVVSRLEGYRDFAREIIGSIELPIAT